MAAAIRAGLLYFLGTFAIGFALGTVRTLLLVPRVGALAAVAMEVPLMLLASWWVCGVVLRRFPVPPARLLRLTMGGSAFLLLMLAELALAVWGFGQSPRRLCGRLCQRRRRSSGSPGRSALR